MLSWYLFLNKQIWTQSFYYCGGISFFSTFCFSPVLSRGQSCFHANLVRFQWVH
jgi:hypothetical protein